jgi:hypothetical protein
MEAAVNGLITDLQAGKFIRIQEAKGRNLYASSGRTTLRPGRLRPSITGALRALPDG